MWTHVHPFAIIVAMADIPPPTAIPPAPPEPPPDFGRRLFFNAVEPRAGWRLLLFAAVLWLIFQVLVLIGRLFPAPPPPRPSGVSIRFLIAGDGVIFLVALLATLVMSRFEARPMRVYGLALRQAFRKNFWIGAAWGLGALTLLLLVLRACHAFYFGHVILHGAQIPKYAVLIGIGFLLVGLSEEYSVRAYPQFTITTGIGFWPAAILTSLVFMGLHANNPGEDKLGLFEVFLIAIFFCLTLRRTGNLWFAVGFHTGWDWGQSYLYGTPDSGLIIHGRLMASSHAGPNWLSGGSVGPEGSVLNLALYVLLVVLFHFTYRRAAVYPDPAGIKTPVPIAASPQIV